MINKVSFMGNVYYLGNTDLMSKNKPNERNFMQEYADDKNCEVVVLDRDYYVDGTGKYKTLTAWVDKTTGQNVFYKALFDFKRGTIEHHLVDL